MSKFSKHACDFANCFNDLTLRHEIFFTDLLFYALHIYGKRAGTRPYNGRSNEYCKLSYPMVEYSGLKFSRLQGEKNKNKNKQFYFINQYLKLNGFVMILDNGKFAVLFVFIKYCFTLNPKS